VKTISALKRQRGVGVRDHVLVLPSVGCANSVVDRVGLRVPGVVSFTHQHGCAQIGDDLRLTAGVLASFGSHPNVASTVVVGLGCESNQAHRLAALITERGGEVRVVNIQDAGGVLQAVEACETVLREFEHDVPERVDVPVSELRVAVVADDEASPAVYERIASLLAVAGAQVLVAEGAGGEAAARQSSFPDGGVPASWRGERRARRGLAVLGAARDVPAAGHDVERLTALCSLGAHVAVFVTGRASPIGNPVVPTVKVGTDPRWSVLDEILDASVSDASEAGAVVDVVLDVASGRPTASEGSGQRDVAIPRIGPTL
jgi:altronate dehydratase large subunit